MIDKRLLQLAHYCRSIGYLRSLTTGAVRVDLDGAAAGTVTDEPAALAAARLATATRRERANGPGHANPANPSPARRRDKIGCLPCVNPTKSKR
jgi:sRNA-binding protein